MWSQSTWSDCCGLFRSFRRGGEQERKALPENSTSEGLEVPRPNKRERGDDAPGRSGAFKEEELSFTRRAETKLRTAVLATVTLSVLFTRFLTGHES